jgi:hypothetical protein
MLLLASGAKIAIKALRAREEFLHALVKVLVVKETIAREEWLTLWNQFTDKEVTDEQVEAELKTHWVQLFALSDEV